MNNRKSRKIFHRKRRIPILLLGSLAVLLLLGLVSALVFRAFLAGHTVEGQSGRAEAAIMLDKQSDTTPPAIALVIDDVGDNTSNLDKWLEIDAPLTFSVMPYGNYSADLAERLYQAGNQIMLHIPTENFTPSSYPVYGQIDTAMNKGTVFRTLDDNKATVPHVVGINNHEGEKGCCNLRLMTWECEWAAANNLFVVDSMNAQDSMVSAAAESCGLVSLRNQAFIDVQNNPDNIRSALLGLAAVARSSGIAVATCHFSNPYTPQVVGDMIGELEAQGIHFVFIQDLINESKSDHSGSPVKT